MSVYDSVVFTSLHCYQQLMFTESVGNNHGFFSSCRFFSWRDRLLHLSSDCNCFCHNSLLHLLHLLPLDESRVNLSRMSLVAVLRYNDIFALRLMLIACKVQVFFFATLCWFS